MILLNDRHFSTQPICLNKIRLTLKHSHLHNLTPGHFLSLMKIRCVHKTDFISIIFSSILVLKKNTLFVFLNLSLRRWQKEITLLCCWKLLLVHRQQQKKKFILRPDRISCFCFSFFTFVCLSVVSCFV